MTGNLYDACKNLGADAGITNLPEQTPDPLEAETPYWPRRRSEGLEFTGLDGDFRRLVTKGAALELVTFGFYRFWLATAMRRHLWQNTKLAGDVFEYTGTAKELLIGFLFALAILVPIYLGYFLLGLEAERYKAFASVPFGLFFFIFGQFALYRARRYRLTRTTWRGVRFWMTGSGWKYAVRALLWNALTVLSLGLALPWRNAALERYKMAHTHYGSLQGSFVGEGRVFFKSAWGLWLSSLILVGGVLAPDVYVLFFRVSEKLDTNSGRFKTTGALTLIAMIFLAIVGPFIYGAYKAKEWKWWVEGVRFGEVSATSSLKTNQFISNTWKLIGISLPIIAVYLGIVIAIMQALVKNPAVRDLLFSQVSAGNQTWFQAGIALNVAIYLLFMIMFGIVMRIYLQQRVWKIVINSTSLQNAAALNNIAAQGDQANALGEGFADSLDIVGL